MKGNSSVFIIIFLIIYSSIGIASNEIIINNSVIYNKPLKITVDWIEAIDPMDIADGPEWYFTIRVYKSDQDYSQYQEIIEYADGTYDHWDVEKTYEFEVFSNYIPISIILNEDDVAFDDTADISALLGDGPDDVDGKIFGVFYDLDKKEIIPRPDDESWDEDGDYLIINGELDGRGTPGPEEEDDKEDDAKMRIKIEDTLPEYSATLSIKGDIWTTRTNVDVTYECNVQGGVPPYQYNLYPCSPFDDSRILSKDTSKTNVELTFKYVIGDHGYYSPHLVVTDSLGTYAIFTLEDGILVNNPPNPPSKPTYDGYLPTVGHKYSVTQTTDPDNCGNFQYQWGYDGQKSEWGGLTIYLENKPGTVKVRARDDGDVDGEFDDGLESDWSEALPKSKNIYINIIDILLQKLPFLSKSLIFL